MSEYDNIGQFVKDKLDGHRETPSGDVWNKLEGQIPSGAASPPVKSWWIAAAGVITVAAVLYFAVFNNSEKNLQPTKKAQEPVAEKIVTDQNDQPATERDQPTVEEKTVKPEPEPQKTAVNIHETPGQEIITEKDRQTSEFPVIESRKPALDSQNPVKNKVPIENPELEPYAANDNVFVSSGEPKDHGVRKVAFSEDKTVCAGEKTALWASGGKRYYWSTGSTDSAVSVLPHQNSKFTVTVTNDADKEIIHDFNLTVQECAEVYIPNAFTPNADGSNDIFRAYGVAVEEFRMQIYDRTGNIIFETESISEGWDGNHLDRPANEGVYLYRIVYTGVEGESKTLTGTLTLIR